MTKKIFKFLNKTPIGQTKWFQILLNEEIKRERAKNSNTWQSSSKTKCEILPDSRVYKELSEKIGRELC